MSETRPGKRAQLLALASQTKTPIAARFEVMQPADIDSSDFVVRSNGLWLARWSGSTIMLLIIRESSPQTVLAAPVTIEPGLQDEETVVVDASANDLGLPITVWLGITREVPIQTLERRLGELSSRTLDAARSTSRASVVLPAIERESPHWASPSVEKRAELEDTLESWIKDLKPLPSITAESGPSQGRPSITLKQVMEALNAPQRKAMNIIRGTYQLSPAEAEQLALHVGLPAEALSSFAEPLPNALLVELQQPRWRFLVRSEAERLKTDEPEARLAVAREAYALAARQQGQGTNIWRQRLRTIALGHLSGGTSEGS